MLDEWGQESIVTSRLHIGSRSRRKAGYILSGKRTTFDVPLEVLAEFLGECFSREPELRLM